MKAHIVYPICTSFFSFLSCKMKDFPSKLIQMRFSIEIYNNVSLTFSEWRYCHRHYVGILQLQFPTKMCLRQIGRRPFSNLLVCSRVYCYMNALYISLYSNHGPKSQQIFFVFTVFYGF